MTAEAHARPVLALEPVEGQPGVWKPINRGSGRLPGSYVYEWNMLYLGGRYDPSSESFRLGSQDYDLLTGTWRTPDLAGVARQQVAHIEWERQSAVRQLQRLNRYTDGFHAGLDLIGLIPVLGEIADVANAAVYQWEGRHAEAALSYAAALPVIGVAATAGKLAKGAKFASLADARRFAEGYRDWANAQQLSAAQSKHVWGLVKQAKRNNGSLYNFNAEVGGLAAAIEQFGANGRGFQLLSRSFGYGRGGRRGVDLVFRQRIGNQVIDHVVEAKGFARNSVGGYFTMFRKQGSEAWSVDRLTKAAQAGNRNADRLLDRVDLGNVRFYTSFTDGVYQW